MARSTGATNASRRPWPMIGALLIFIVFTGIHQLGFGPAIARYRKVLGQARDMGLVLGPGAPPPMLSPHVMRLLGDNALAGSVAEQQGNSGALSSAMLADLTRIAGRNGLEVLSTEQGSVTQLKSTTLVRAHLRLRCDHDEFLRFLDGLVASGMLYSVDRFTLESAGDGRQSLDLWVSQLILKQATRRS